MKRWLVVLAACGSPREKATAHLAEKPTAVQLVVGDEKHGIGLFDLDGKLVERWSTKRTDVIVGALPQKRGVVAMSEGDVRIVRPGEDKVVAHVGMAIACGTGESALAVKNGRVSTSGRAACLGLVVFPSQEIAVAVTVDLMTGKEYRQRVTELPDCRMMEQAAPPEIACALLPKPLAKTLEIEGEPFALVSISPTKRWEVYVGTMQLRDGLVAQMVFVDAIAKQRYALLTDGPWPAALVPGHKVTGSWPTNPQLEWLADDIASIDAYTLVQAGKRVSRPGSFIRW